MCSARVGLGRPKWATATRWHPPSPSARARNRRFGRLHVSTLRAHTNRYTKPIYCGKHSGRLIARAAGRQHPPSRGRAGRRAETTPTAMLTAAVCRTRSSRPLRARNVSQGWPKVCKLARAFMWEYIQEDCMQLAQLLMGQLGYLAYFSLTSSYM